jgi:Domain of unknown function (DUF4129)
VNTALRRIWPLIAVGVLLGAAALASSLSATQLRHSSHPLLKPPAGGLPSPRLSPLVARGGPSPLARDEKTIQLGWLSGVLEALCVLAVLVIVGVLVFLVLRGSLESRKARLRVDAAQPPAAARREDVIAAVDAGLSDLDADERDPRRAVIACWVRLEQAAAAAGTPREPGDSPTDLVLRLLATHQVSAQVLYPLADVYRLARYATHVVDSGMRDQARAALRQLRAELTTSRSGPLEHEPVAEPAAVTGPVGPEGTA